MDLVCKFKKENLLVLLIPLLPKDELYTFIKSILFPSQVSRLMLSLLNIFVKPEKKNFGAWAWLKAEGEQESFQNLPINAYNIKVLKKKKPECRDCFVHPVSTAILLACASLSLEGWD